MRGIRTGIAIGTAVLLAACGGSDNGTVDGTDDASGDDTTPDESSAVIDGEFRTTISSDPGSLDPHLTILSITRWVASFAYDSLVVRTDAGESLPGLAESWEVDLTSVTYTLKEGITCSDGSELTATDVADNFEFVADPASQSPQLGVFVQPGVTVTADDAAGTVTIEAPQPDPFILEATGSVQIVCRAGLDDRSLLESETVGTGMFALAEAVVGDHYTFERRDEYAWGPDGGTAEDAGTPETVTLRVVGNESTAANLFLSGDLDAVSLAGADVDRVEQSGADSRDFLGPLGLLWFNQGEGHPAADPDVRLALTQATNLDELRAALTSGAGAPATRIGLLEPKVCDADTVSGSLPDFDTASAADALDAAGWTADADGVRTKDGEPLAMTFLYVPGLTDGATPAAELLAQQWGEIGVDVTLRGVTNPEANEVLFGTGDWDAGIVPLGVNFPTQLVPFMSGPAAPDGTNFAHIANSEYESLAGEASQLLPDEGCATWDDADRALISNADVVPFADTVVKYFSNGVDGAFTVGNIVPPTIRMHE